MVIAMFCFRPQEQNPLLEGTGPYVGLDVMNKGMLHVQIIRQILRQLYLLAAILSATGEKNPGLAWQLNMAGTVECIGNCKRRKTAQGILAIFYSRLWTYFTKTELSAAYHY
jgi:hypothetical protein